MNLNNVTLICVDGVGKNDSSKKAINKSILNIQFAKVILLTCDNLIKDINAEIIKIPRMNWNEYNEFIISKLSNYFDTEFVLLCQDDGYISNYQMWDNKFLDYDYIGAPWPQDLMSQLMYNLEKNVDLNGEKFQQEIKLKNYNPNNYRVGNGGFSLRSQKLCKFVQQYSNKYTNKPEDNIISIYEKEDIENAGMKIAPIELAAKFSVESANEFNPNRDRNKTFGFHRF